MTDSASAGLQHPDLSPKRIAKDEENVSAMVEILEKSWINPFSTGASDIVSISTGKAATPAVANDLLRAEIVGKKAYEDFISQRLQSSDVDFHAPIKKLNLKTFKTMAMSKTSKCGNKEIILKADNRLFGKMILIANNRELNLENVLNHPLGPLPWSLANGDGSMKKTAKARLAKKLEALINPAEVIEKPSACIIDAMSVVQKCPGEGKTFAQIGKDVLNTCLTNGHHSQRIDIVFDVYKENSIKIGEREKRGSSDGIMYKVLKPDSKVTQWRRFLACTESKILLIDFFLSYWQMAECTSLMKNKEIYVTNKGKCFKISKEGTVEAHHLRCDHEEADTRMLLHANSVAQKATVVVCDDADVLAIILAVCNQIRTKLYLKCGTKARERYIDVNKLASVLNAKSPDRCAALLGFHAFTGCDSVSAFAGQGKVGPLKLLDEQEFETAMKDLGSQWEIAPKTLEGLEKFVCRMYSSKSKVSKVNELRYHIFKAKKGDVESGQLPPCNDTFVQHALRANYQAAIWRRCLENFPEIPLARYHGWTMEDGHLTIKWMSGKPAPQAVLQLLACACKKECQPSTCQCIINKLKCTDACTCNDACANMYEEEDNVHDESIIDDDYDEEDI